MESVQPYNRGNSLLSIHKALNNFDKHRLIPVVTSTAQITLFGMEGIHIVVPPGETVAILRQSTRPIEDGAELWRTEIGDGVIAGDVRVRAGFAFEFVFEGVPAIASKQYVGKTLQDIRNEVRWVLGHF